MLSGLIIWPCAVKMGASGQVLDSFQGIYSRGLCWALASALLRTRALSAIVCLPTVRIGDVTSWAVSGRQWTPHEALHKGFVEPAQFMTWGTVSVTDLVEVNLVLLSREHHDVMREYEIRALRSKLLNCLSEIAIKVATFVLGRPLTKEELRLVECWGTSNPEAFLAYLEAWSAGAAIRFGVSVPNPDAALNCAARAVELDPGFSEARALHGELRLAHRSTRSGSSEFGSYRECAYRVETGITEWIV